MGFRGRVGRKARGRTHSHAQKARGVVLELEALVREGLGAVDGGAAGAVAVEEVAALDHEVFDLDAVASSESCAAHVYFAGVLQEEGTNHSVEFAALVALGEAAGIFALAGAVLAEVFSGAGDGVGEEFHFDAA